MLLLLAPVERDLHPHDDSVVEVQTSPSVPEYRYPFRMNESHTFLLSGCKRLQTQQQVIRSVRSNAVLDKQYTRQLVDTSNSQLKNILEIKLFEKAQLNYEIVVKRN
jgi:hypothetical protein